MPTVHAWCTSPPALMQDPFVVGADAREVPQQTKGMHSKEVRRSFEAAPAARAEQSLAVRCAMWHVPAARAQAAINPRFPPRRPNTNKRSQNSALARHVCGDWSALCKINKRSYDNTLGTARGRTGGK